MCKVDLRDVYEWSVIIEAEDEAEVEQKAQEILDHHRQEFKKYMSQYPKVDSEDFENWRKKKYENDTEN